MNAAIYWGVRRCVYDAWYARNPTDVRLLGQRSACAVRAECVRWWTCAARAVYWHVCACGLWSVVHARCAYGVNLPVFVRVQPSVCTTRAVPGCVNVRVRDLGVCYPSGVPLVR